MTLPSGTGYTLRTYNGEDDDPIFLGSDLTVYLFRTADGLMAYCRAGDEHDLTEMVTWPDIADAEELPVEPDPQEVYDLRGPSEDAIELALELADYCDLNGVTATLTRRRTGDIPFDTWTAAIDRAGDLRPLARLTTPGCSSRVLAAPAGSGAGRGDAGSLRRAAGARAGGRAGQRPIDYRLAAPKWQFLCHVADRGEAVLHGSSAPDIDCFEPRQSNDIAEFGNRTAVYAAADGLWALYFAILDRPASPDVADQQLLPRRARGRHVSEPYYFFSVNNEVARAEPVRPGDGLPAAAGEVRAGGADRRARRTVRTAQAACLEPVEPMAKLTIEPADFPLPIRGHDLRPQLARIEADPGGFPWLAARRDLTDGRPSHRK